MKKKAHHYYHEPQIGKNRTPDCALKEYDMAMPVYPKALRFCITDYEQAFKYMRGVKDFIQSTKIPESCKECPIKVPCLLTIEQHDCCGDTQCRITWRKIWEYVK